jgi:ABC-type transport system involved in cytochrome c biogenesis permease subunit
VSEPGAATGEQDGPAAGPALRGDGRTVLRRAGHLVGSFGVAVTLLLLLLVLTFAGTLAQGSMSLYDVQARYFDALVAVVDVGPLSIPLPGAALTLALLAVNLVVGGVIRMRRGSSTFGILVAHLGILLLLGGGLVEALASDKGQMTLHEPATPGVPDAASESDRFESYYDWELVVGEREPDGTRRDHVVPWSRLHDLEGGTLRATTPELPFDVVVSGWTRNGRPRRATTPGTGVEGWVTEALEPEHEAERNVPMAAVTLAPRGRSNGPRSLVWGLQAFPWAVSVENRTFEVLLRHRSWSLPFSIRLDRFVHETHPGTRIDSRFSSYVTKVENGVERDVHITMNEPLRHGGYTFYQSGWGPRDAPPGARHFSTFAVVRNPADRVPIFACLVIAAGLVIHFGRKLFRHVRSSAAGRAPARAGAAAGRRPSRVPAAVTGALAVAVLGASAIPAVASTRSRSGAWTPATLESAAALPLQDGGRIKPLDSHAAFTLLRLNHKRSCSDAEGNKVGALEWMLDVLFRPDVARRHPCFLVEDSQVLDAVGLAHEGRNRRDRYAFDDLAPVRDRVAALARKYMEVESKERSQVENGVVELYGDLETFSSLAHAFDFARADVAVPAAPGLRALWPGRDRIGLGEVLDHLQELEALSAGGSPGTPAALDAAGVRAVKDWAAEALDAAGALALVPPAGPSDVERAWLTPRDVMLGSRDGGAPPPPEEMDLLARLVGLARSAGDPLAFELAMGRVREASVALAERRGDYRRVPLEVFLNRLDPVYRAIELYLTAFLLLALSWLLPWRWLVRGATALTLAGAAIHLAAIVIRSVLRGHPPVSTLYDTTLAIAFVTVAGFLVAERIHRQGVALVLAPVVGALLLFVGQRFEALKGEDTLPQLVAVLDTNFWLALHVTCVTIGYAGGLLAAAVAHVYVLGRAFGFRRGDAAFYGLLGRMNYGMLAFSLVFAVVGTILGGIWANDSWGRFWGWDPKENGALMICLTQLALLHARMGGLVLPFGVAVGTVGLGCVVAFSWWGVNLLGIGLHSYGFTGGILHGLLVFYGIEVAVLAVALVTHLTGRSRAA